MKASPAPNVPGSTWAVVLAAGEGRRLRALTHALHGRDLPKQFAEIEPGRTLLQATLDRIAPLVPADRTVVVVDRTQERDARPQLERFPRIDLALQPRNLDTAAGILFPLARILSRDPEARVAIFPSDHDVPRPASFLEAVSAALAASGRRPDRVTLLGVVPEEAEGEYGWIVPEAAGRPADDGGIVPVREFVEKPEPALARRLFERRALWNTFVLAARAAAIFAIAERCVPACASAFRAYADACGGPGEKLVLDAVYERLAAANFSRAVLERAASRLGVVPVAGSGWSDWGSPERVFRSLEERGLAAALRARLRSSERELVPSAC